MAETSWFWDGLVTGDATLAPYNAATEFANVLKAISHSDLIANKGFVFFGHTNNLTPATVGTSPVTIDTGAAIVHGNYYENTTQVNVAIPTPAGATRIDRIVLRKNWTSQTVRITRIAGAEGGAAPAMQQTVGVVWDIPIAEASITTGGAVTLTDTREDILSDDVPTDIAFDALAGAGGSHLPARAGHTHELPDSVFVAQLGFNNTEDLGDSVIPAREDHIHKMPVYIRKRSTISTMVNLIHPELQGAVEINSQYIIFGGVAYADAGGSTMTFALSVPVGTTALLTLIGPDVGTPTTLKGAAASAAGLTFGLDGSTRVIHYHGTVIVGGTAGNVGLILYDGGTGTGAIAGGSTFNLVKV